MAKDHDLFGMQSSSMKEGSHNSADSKEHEVITMNQRIYRSYRETIRDGLSWNELWNGHDKGLITCWEVGKELSKKEPELAERAKKGELPVLGWKGGVKKKTKKKEIYGTLFYLAQWQGLRGDDLDIDLSEESELICSKTGMKVIFTGDVKKYCS